jgi:hypothetical protein
MKRMFLVLLLLASPTIAAADNLDKYVELLRSDLRTVKTELLTEALEFKGDEGAKFWPIQREYEIELAKLGDQRLAMIKDFAANYGNLSPEMAKDLTDRAFKLDASRSALLKKYTGKISKEISPVVGARFAQCESLIFSLVDVKVRSELPLMK